MENNDEFVMQCDEAIAGLTQAGVRIERINHSLNVIDQMIDDEEARANQKGIRGFMRRVWK